MSVVIPPTPEESPTLIKGELRLPFRWYDDVLKQNRYNSYCKVCDFKLITPCDRFLPFQIKTDGVFPLTQWIIYDIDGNQVADLSICIASHLQVVTVDNTDYIVFDGNTSMQNCGFDLECGQYYAMLSDGNSYFYSEVFEVANFDDVEFVQELFQPHLPWRWYDNEEKANSEKANCARNCGFCLLTSDEALLPFQFRRPTVVAPVDEFYLTNVDDENCGITLEPSSIQIVTIGDYDYFIYTAPVVPGLTPGTYVGTITSGGTTYTSERICITCGIGEGSFLLQETGFKILQETADGILLDT